MPWVARGRIPFNRIGCALIDPESVVVRARRARTDLDAGALIRAADENLYAATTAGRIRVVSVTREAA